MSVCPISLLRRRNVIKNCVSASLPVNCLPCQDSVCWFAWSPWQPHTVLYVREFVSPPSGLLLQKLWPTFTASLYHCRIPPLPSPHSDALDSDEMNRPSADYLPIGWQSRNAGGSFYISLRSWCEADLGNAERGCSVSSQIVIPAAYSAEEGKRVWLFKGSSSSEKLFLEPCQATAGVWMFQAWHSREGLALSQRNIDWIIRMRSALTVREKRLNTVLL